MVSRVVFTANCHDISAYLVMTACYFLASGKRVDARNNSPWAWEREDEPRSLLSGVPVASLSFGPKSLVSGRHAARRTKQATQGLASPFVRSRVVAVRCAEGKRRGG